MIVEAQLSTWLSHFRPAVHAIPWTRVLARCGQEAGAGSLTAAFGGQIRGHGEPGVPGRAPCVALGPRHVRSYYYGRAGGRSALACRCPLGPPSARPTAPRLATAWCRRTTASWPAAAFAPDRVSRQHLPQPLRGGRPGARAAGAGGLEGGDPIR